MKKIFNEIISLLRLNRGTNLKVASLCILAATLFWFFNALNKEYSANVNYPISFIYDPNEYMAVDELPEEVLLNMSGVGWNLLRKSFGLKVEPVQIRLENPDLVNWVSGSTLPSAITDQVSDLQLNYVLTDTLYVNIDRKVSRKFRLWLDPSTIDIADGYAISSTPGITPDSVDLMGPRDLLMSMGDSVEVIIMDEDVDELFDSDIEVIVPRQNLIRRDPPTVRVNFGVESLEELAVDVPVQLVNAPSSAYVTDSLLSVSIRLLESEVSQFNGENMRFMADFREMLAVDSTVVPKLISVPEIVADITYDSTAVKVYFRE